MDEPKRQARLATAVALAAVLLCASAVAGGRGSIRGKVTLGGLGRDGVAVEVHREQKKSADGTPFALTETRDGGRFEIELPDGDYYLWARESAPVFGQPRVTEYRGNPVRVTFDETTALEPLEIKEVGDPVVHVADREKLAAVEKSRREGSAATRLSGIVKGPDGKTLAGHYVFLYREPGMIDRPDAMAVTGEDGSFTFDLPGGGTVYLGARSAAGGLRQPGEMTGRLADSTDSSVNLADGAVITGLVIQMGLAR